MKSISIIIVNYNVTSEIVKSLKSIQKYFSAIPLEIIVIDNNSSDRSVIEKASIFPDVRFIFLKENAGFAQANNTGVKNSVSDYILFLNPDTIIIEDFITPIIQFIELNSLAGACGPMLLNKDKSYQNSFGNNVGFFYEFSEAFMIVNAYRKLMRYFLRKKMNSSEPFEVGWISGACLLIRRNLFDKINGFNQDYFLNYEDIDLCTRSKNLGYKNFYFPFLKCIHVNQASQKQDFEKLTYSRYVSKLIFAKDNYNFAKRFLVRFIHLIGLLLRLIFVNIIYSKIERKQRLRGYFKSTILYLGLIRPGISNYKRNTDNN